MEFLGLAGAVAACLVVGGGLTALATLAEDGVEPEYAAVCMDQRTGNRLDDDACGDWDDDGVGHVAGTYFMWLPIGDGVNVPPVGRPLASGQGVRTVPRGASLAKGAPKAGGAITRGGLGATAKGASGGKAGSAGS
jgi:hypothetical protein